MSVTQLKAWALVFCVPWVAAAADSKRACIAASERAQDERSKGHLGAARADLLVCAQESCPAPVRRVCEDWLRQVDPMVPSVVIRVRDPAGRDLAAVRVLIDGQLVSPALDGRSIPVDPGMHVFRFEPDGFPAFEDHLLIVESEKSRLVTETAPVDVPSPPVPAPAPVPALTPEVRASLPPPPLLEQHATRSIPAASWILAGVGVAASAGFVAFTVSGSNLYSTCVSAPCSDAARSAIDLRRGLAWASLGVAVASFAGAGGLFLTATPSVQVSVAPLPTGGMAEIHGRF